MSGFLLETNMPPFPSNREAYKGIRLYFPTINHMNEADVKALIKRFIDEMTVLMNKGELEQGTAISRTMLLLSDLHN